MIFINEIEDLKLYKKQFRLPIVDKNKKKGSAVFLLTPNIKSSEEILTNPLIINSGNYISYFIEKDITYYLNEDNGILTESVNILLESDNIDKNYGLPEKKKYPMPDNKHVLSAIKFFNYVEPNSKDEKILASNIIANIKKFNIREINVGDKNRFKKYYDKALNESAGSIVKTLNTDNTKNVKQDQSSMERKLKYEIDRPKRQFDKNQNTKISEPQKENPKLSSPVLSNPQTVQTKLSNPRTANPVVEGCYSLINEAFEDLKFNDLERYDYIHEQDCIKDGYLKCNVDGNNLMIIFNENLDEQVLCENAANNKILYKILYKERLKNNKEVYNVYDQVKTQVPWISKTYTALKQYKGLNLFIDLAYYNNTFFKNNIYKLDKGANLYFDFMNRLLSDKRIDDAGYKVKTVFVPVEDWYNEEVDTVYKLSDSVNPISVIYRLVKKNPSILQKWKGIDFVFITNKGYFKCDISNLNMENIALFKKLIDKLIIKAEIIDNDNTESKKSIVSNIIDKIETSQKIKINNLTGNGKQVTKDDIDDRVNNAAIKSDDTSKPTENDEKKNELVKIVKNAANTSSTTNDAIDALEKDDKLKEILNTLADEESGNVKINAARASRINKLQNEFLDTKVNNKSVRDMIEKASNDEPLPTTDLKVDSINDEWKNLKYVNFEKIYDPNDDIMDILYSLSKKTIPVMVRNIEVTDTSTSEDYKKTYNVQMEDVNGNRFTIKFDIPDLINDKFLQLRGNKKTISGQLTQIPIMKTDDDTVQIVSNYNKIFISRYGTTSGKSFPVTDKIIKTLAKYKENDLKITFSDNTRVCKLYELPIDYIDFASIYNILETKNTIIYFNQDLIREKYKIDDSKGIPFGYNKKEKKVLYYEMNKNLTFSYMLYSILFDDLSKEFDEIFKQVNLSTRYCYSKASILSAKIPLIVIMGYSEGLTKAMDKAKIEYELSEKRLYSKNDDFNGCIKFKDGFLYYRYDYNSSMLMNGLKECNTEDFSLTEINGKAMFLEFLEIFGTRILADGLDNFYDLMIDPITKEVLEKYKTTTDYVELLAYANMLLCDNKFIEHGDMRGRRYRSNEIIAGYAYKALSESYGSYKTELKRRGKGSMTIKQSSIIDKILQDPTASDVSILNDLLLIEAINTVSYKGLSGMNSDRSYSLDKRTYDKSMLNILGLSTGFAANVGISRQATLDMNVESKRGYLKVTDDPDELSVTKTFTATEALTPFGTLRDDPFRSAMTFIQTSKHGMRIADGTPSLISNGADQAIAYMTPNIFSFKAKTDGKITVKTDEYMIIKYKDGTSDFVDLRNKIEKNSNGGIYISIKLDSDLKVGSTVKEKQIVAYDKLSYSDKIGDSGIAYNLGALANIAILNTDEGYEDSAIISEYLSETMASEVVIKKEVVLSKNTNIYNMVKKGQPIQEGDPLIIFQNAFEDEDVNILLKNLAGDAEDISDIGRIPVKSHVTGIVEDIKIFRTVDKEELSDSLRKKVNEIEKPITDLKKVMKQNNIEGENRLDADSKLEAVGKLKNAEDKVLIEFYLKYNDKMSVGDKLIYYSALKGVVKDIFPSGKEPYTQKDKNEKIQALLSLGSINARMVTSIKINLAINKVLVELDRKVKEIHNVPWKYLDQM